jgi:flagellar hook-length control protein FliK
LQTEQGETPADTPAAQPSLTEAPPLVCPAQVPDIMRAPAKQRPIADQPELPVHDAAQKPAQPAMAKPDASQPKFPGGEPPISPTISDAASAKPVQAAPVAPSPEAAPPSMPVSPDPAPRTAPAAAASTATTLPSDQAPAAQVAPVLVRLSHAPDGAQRLTVRLDPPELGHVQVRIDRPPEAPARVEITVEKAETLQMLLRDQPQLQRALDQAGVPAEGRSISFHIAAPEPAPRSEPLTPPAAGVAAGGLSGDGSHGTQRQNGQPGQQQGHMQDTGQPDATSAALTGWVRGGLDITA